MLWYYSDVTVTVQQSTVTELLDHLLVMQAVCRSRVMAVLINFDNIRV